MDPQHHNHHHHNHQFHHPPPPQMISGAAASYPTPNMHNTSDSSHLFQNNRFPFTSKPLESLNSPFSGDGSPAFRPGLVGIDSVKKKRGRPRKYSPDGGNIALGLAPTPIGSGGGGGGGGDSSGTPSSEGPVIKKHRGRPPGSSKVQLDALGNCGVGFTPHVILVKAGEDIASKIMAFSQQGPRTVCVLSANGSVSNVTLRQLATSGGSITYEGRFEIISLSGSFLFSENGCSQVRSGGLSISLAGSDGRVVGGGVAGMLMAATHVQIIVGSFVADGKKSKYMPAVTKSQMLNFSGPAPTLPAPPSGTPPSQDPSSESSDEDNANHIDRAAPVPFHNSNQPIHNMQQLYSSMGWPGSATAKMLSN